MKTTQTNITKDQPFQIEQLAPELERGPHWLKERRFEARESFNNSPLPKRGVHLWRYTDPKKFLIDRDAVSDTSFGENYDKTERMELEHLRQGHLSALAIDLGGRDISVHTSESIVKDGVIVCKLSDAVQSHPELIEKYLYQLVNNDNGKFEALNGALWNDGLFVYVPKSVTVDKPVHLLREAGLQKSAAYPRLLVVVEENAELTLIDEYGGGTADITGGSYCNSAVEIFGLANSRVRYLSLQRQAKGTTTFLTHRARLDQGASMMTLPLSFGGAVTKQNFGVILNGEGAHSDMYGILFGTGRQHFDNHTLHHHAAGKTTSNIDFKVVLRDRAQSAYTGLIRIDEKAPFCEAYQTNRNLLLNKGTKAETIPELEILNEEVSCSHGATMGPIDPEMIFYLGSRGIDRATAVRMIVSGFVESTLAVLPEDLAERIKETVMLRLEEV